MGFFRSSESDKEKRLARLTPEQRAAYDRNMAAVGMAQADAQAAFERASMDQLLRSGTAGHQRDRRPEPRLWNPSSDHWPGDAETDPVRLLRHRRRPERQAHRPDVALERIRAEAAAEVEEHDIDDMLDAIEEHRRRRGARGLGEQLADDLERGTWEA